MKQADLKADLYDQLARKGMDITIYQSLVDDYIEYWKIKRELQKDVRKNGLRVEYVNGNGIKTEKFNEAVVQLPKITNAMLSILKDLGLKEPVAAGSSDDDYL